MTTYRLLDSPVSASEAGGGAFSLAAIAAAVSSPSLEAQTFSIGLGIVAFLAAVWPRLKGIYVEYRGASREQDAEDRKTAFDQLAGQLESISKMLKDQLKANVETNTKLGEVSGQLASTKVDLMDANAKIASLRADNVRLMEQIAAVNRTTLHTDKHIVNQTILNNQLAEKIVEPFTQVVAETKRQSAANAEKIATIEARVGSSDDITVLPKEAE